VIPVILSEAKDLTCSSEVLRTASDGCPQDDGNHHRARLALQACVGIKMKRSFNCGGTATVLRSLLTLSLFVPKRRTLQGVYMFRKILVIVCLVSPTMLPMSYADEGAAASLALSQQVEQLSSQVSSLQEMLKKQSAEIAKLNAYKAKDEVRALPVPVAKGAELPDWIEGLDFGGDFRLRQDSRWESSDRVPDRNRFRVRLRYGATKTFNQDLKIGARIVSGSTTSPTSTNVTLDGNFVYKSLQWDRAYVAYSPSWLEEHLPLSADVKVYAGKFANPYKKPNIFLWDVDVTPEGAYEQISLKLMDGVDFTTTLGQFILDEDGVSVNSELYAFEGAFKFDLESVTNMKALEGVKWTSSYGFYNYDDYAKDTNFGAFASGNSNNDPDTTTLDALEFHVWEMYNAIDLSILSTPVKLYFDFIFNSGDRDPDPDDATEAWQLGLIINKAEKKGDWALGGTYFWYEANAAVGAFMDADIGNADNRGMQLWANYKLADYWTLRSALFFFNRITAERLAIDNDRRHLQIDMNWKF